MLETALQYSLTHRQEHLDSLNQLLAIPSISTLPEHEPDIQRAAQWMVSYLAGIGLTRVEVSPTAGLPVVYGEWLGAEPDAATVLLYGHYDVQPADPLEEWLSPPFEPTIRDGNLYCRGAADDKGQFMAVLAAAESWLQTSGRLPINLKVMLESEEEIGSENLAAWVEEHREVLAADAVLVCDSPMLADSIPVVVTGTRGMVYMQIDLRGPKTDLHSGIYGGAVDNPFNVLVRVLAQLQDGETRRVLIPGFYDRVRPADAEERVSMNRAVSDDSLRASSGVPALAGEPGWTAMERTSVRPSLDIHGIPGGFTGPGKKTVIPAVASAKVSMRLAPDQDPVEIAQLFREYVLSLIPPTVVAQVTTLDRSYPAVVDYRVPAIQAMARALEETFAVAPVYLRLGGTLPIVPDFQRILGASVIMAGFGLPDDNLHGPNEKISLANFYRGIEAVIRFFDGMGNNKA